MPAAISDMSLGLLFFFSGACSLPCLAVIGFRYSVPGTLIYPCACIEDTLRRVASRDIFGFFR